MLGVDGALQSGQPNISGARQLDGACAHRLDVEYGRVPKPQVVRVTDAEPEHERMHELSRIRLRDIAEPKPLASSA